jgi:integrase
MRMTDASLRSMRPQKKAYDVHADGRQGLIVRVYPNGAKSFRMRYTVNGLRDWWVMGEYGRVTLADAYDRHHSALREIAQGLNPREEHEKREAEAARLAHDAKLKKGITVRRVIAVWAFRYARHARKRPQEAVRLLKKYLGEPWAGIPLHTLRRENARKLLDGIVARNSKVMANRICALAEQAFTVAVQENKTEINPFLAFPPPGGAELPRERWLYREEVKRFWEALDDPKYNIRRRMALALRLVLVTAQRPGELTEARISEFDLKQRIWTIPPEHIKTEPKNSTKVHLVPLTDLAVELITELISLTGDRPCLLPSGRSKQQFDQPIHEKTLSHVLSDLVEGEGKKATLFGLPPFHPHDLRRTASTHMSKAGAPRLVIDKVLNHSDSSQGGIYDRNEFFKEKRQALTTWEGWLRDILAGKPEPEI